ncbi:MAG TPA: hypothetical protein VKA55_10055 [Gammaproteobacteria bacterium]|nr:hypothetical protein [Gammaproteobacteria bacterium]
MQALIRIAAVLLTVVALPLAGAAWDGRSPGAYLGFPPRTAAVTPAPFAWPVFLLGAAAVAAVLIPFLVRILRHAGCAQPAPAAGRLPAWGWAALVLLVVSWAAAWGAFGGPEALRRHAFTTLWLGYIGLANAWTARRAGTCLLTRRPATVAGLLAASAVFWWGFEYLNQFTRNWHYLGLAARGDWGYFLAASPPFATVLAAVLSTRDLLATYPRLSAGLGDAWRPPLPGRTGRSAACLLLGAAALVAVGADGERFFPLLWLGPLLLIWGVQGLAGEPTLLDDAAAGDWRPLWLAALAALACGLLWEMWNAGSLARWQYAVPYVDRFRLFAMPALGYAGYLPFGLECVAAAGLVFGGRRTDLRRGLPGVADT